MRLGFLSRAILAVLATAAVSSPASADMLIELPTAWRLENYANENIVIWFTGASAVGCTNGRLAPDSAMSAQDRSRLWSLVLSAKLSNRKVGLSYSGTGNACVITSFFID